MIGAAIAGLGGLAGGIFGGLSGRKGQKDANETNLRIAREAREHDVSMWERQTAYNTPEMQMQRLREAGLNPNLIYGKGTASTGQADAPKQAPVPEVQNIMASMAQDMVTPALSMFNDFRVKRAQVNKLQNDASLVGQKTQTERDRRLGVQYTNQYLKARGLRANELFNQEVINKMTTNQLNRTRVKAQNIQNRILKLNRELVEETNPKKIQLLNKQIWNLHKKNKQLDETIRSSRVRANIDENLEYLNLHSGDSGLYKMLGKGAKQLFEQFMKAMTPTSKEDAVRQNYFRNRELYDLSRDSLRRGKSLPPFYN